MLDTDFPFGANDPSEVTAIVTDSDRLTWRDVEALRIEARSDVATVADAHWTRALSYVARLKVPCVRAWAARWLTFCTVGGARPPRHIGEAGKACRKVELALARLGVIDPHGFEEREAPKPSRASKTRAMRRRQNRGGDCGGLREFNERMRGPWVG
jgi:hypothetical protein